MTDEPAVVGERGRLVEGDLREVAVIRVDHDAPLAWYDHAGNQEHRGVVARHRVDGQRLRERAFDGITPSAEEVLNFDLTS